MSIEQTRNELGRQIFKEKVKPFDIFAKDNRPGLDSFYAQKEKGDSNMNAEELSSPQEVNPIRADKILADAHKALAQRAVIRDQPKGERSAARAAAIMTAWTGREYCEKEIWQVMVAIKMARSEQGKFHEDDYIDMAGFAALLGECEASLSK